jgi:hypothetical protein
MTILFVDTNFFLEGRKITDIPWQDLPGGCPDEIDLIVPAGVVTEIDLHKGNKNSRKAKRAREASAQLRKALQTSEHRIVIKEISPRVTLSLPSVLKIDYSKWPLLERERVDHRIVAEVATYCADVAHAQLVSDDTNLVIAARAIGLAWILTPESWRSADESDERDKEAARLSNELRKYQNSRPEIRLSVYGRSLDEAAELLELKVGSCEASPDAVARLVDRVRLLNPIATDFQLEPAPTSRPEGLLSNAALIGAWTRPSPEEIRIYQEERYPAWLREVKEAIEGIPARLIASSRTMLFSLSVVNEGYANAADLRLTVTAFNGFQLIGVSSKEELRKERRITLPPAPLAPRGRYTHPAQRAFERMMGKMDGAGFPDVHSVPFLGRRDRDPNAFYSIDGEPDGPVEVLELTCSALPHQVEPVWFCYILIAPPEMTATKGRIRIRVQASNLLEPRELHVPVEISSIPVDFESEALKALGFDEQLMN